MKYLKMVGLCLTSMLAISMALAANTSAAPLWLLCLEGTGLTKYSTNQCTTASGTGKWQSLGLASGHTQTVKLLGFSLRLEDTGTGVKIECPDVGVTPGTGAGFIEGPNKGKVTKAELNQPEKEGCKVLKGFLTCTAGKLTKVEAANLPWKTEIFETESKIFGKVESGGAGEPGWSITCGGVTDNCISEGVHEEAILENVVSSGVLLVFGTSAGRGSQKCSVGGAKSGFMAGRGALLLPSGNGLSISSV